MEKHLIGSFLKRIKRPIDLDDNKDYKLVTIKMNHRGVTLREMKKGDKIKSKMYVVKEGDFILSGIDARNGAFGIIPKELDGAIVTNDFWYFDINENIISKKLFLELTATSWFDTICKRGSDGTTQRIRLQKDKFFNQKISLPKIEEQVKLLDKLLTSKEKQSKINNEIKTQKKLLQNLKQSILQEAIEGKLTADYRSQNTTESASELLKRIQEEKKQLIKDKKIKKEKPLPKITKDEIPFQIPDNWVWCRMQETGLFERGKSKHRPRNDSKLFKNGNIPFVQTGEVARSKNNGYLIDSCSTYYNEFGLEQSRLWKKGTMCITIAANIAQTGFLNIDACFPDSVVGFTALSDKSISKYVRYFIEATRSDIEKYAPATAQKNINLGIIFMLKVPLPPVNEIKLIVEKVEEAMSKCSLLEQEIEKSEKHATLLMQSVLKEAFEVA
ncbi:restriction endonuclease subunit S [Bernardetia sp. Wsw4-3y2]|uniref:restriction endonuclease subunit S n=1 Tax=Bernardetia sp. Wsw4-3y2 TaxID=3127471 RepID=UPI0030D389BA